MFLLNGTPLPPDQPFEHDGVQYPSNWLRLASEADKAAIGITEQPDPVRPDDRFYWVDGNNQGTPKDLTELKAQWTKQVDQIAYSLLLPTDWMVVRKSEANVEIPAATTTYRAAVRTNASTNRAAIAAAADVPALIAAIAAFVWPIDPNAPVRV
jgi:hypothetical protein